MHILSICTASLVYRHYQYEKKFVPTGNKVKYYQAVVIICYEVTNLFTWYVLMHRLLQNWMDPRDVEILRKNHVFLVENLNLRDELLKAHLVKEELLTDNDIQRMEVNRILFAVQFWILQNCNIFHSSVACGHYFLEMNDLQSSYHTLTKCSMIGVRIRYWPTQSLAFVCHTL